jgi:NADPH:quinone reductase and related Zn-dependent oxidoreductases
MKAVQITKYSKEINTVINEVPIPQIGPNDVLLKVKAAAVNPLELLILNGKVKLIQNYKMPLTLGNECAGIIEQVGENITKFTVGDRVYTRLPIHSIGAFAQYVAVNENAVALMPRNTDFEIAAAIPLTGLTAYQAIKEEFNAKYGETIFIAGGSGSFGQMAVPIAKEMGLNVIVSGNFRAKEEFLKMGVDQYIDYTKENYWEELAHMDYVIDTLGSNEFERELSILKKGGILLSLKNTPNKYFAEKSGFSFTKKQLFSLAGSKNDKIAKKSGKEYRFIFVQSNGNQLEEITNIVEKRNIRPQIDTHIFNISQVNEALALVARGRTNGKVVIRF